MQAAQEELEGAFRRLDEENSRLNAQLLDKSEQLVVHSGLMGEGQQAVGHVQSMVSEDGHSGGQEQWDSLLTTWQTEV